MSDESKRRFKFLGIALAAVVVLGGIFLYTHVSGSESTDDAFVDAHIIPISPKVAGQVIQVHVVDNQEVKAADPLFEIDDRDYVAKSAEQRAKVAEAEAQAVRAESDAGRYAQIYQKDEISKQQLDQADADAHVAHAKLESARAAAQKADLDLSYTKVTAPESGRVTRKSLETGGYIQVGQILMAIVPNEVWVTANFKETQITHIRAGQPVRIKIDTYPGKVFHGHVDSVQAGTGERFSLLPPENATGNYVKVVQRVPVKIVFDDKPDPNYLLAPGMSVVPTVDVK